MTATPLDLLIPRPASVVVGAGPSASLTPGTVREAVLAARTSLRSATGHHQGPWLTIRVDAAADLVELHAADDLAVRRAGVVLDALLDGGRPVPPLTVVDEPTLPRRGVVEGFYGPPWSHRERLDFLAFAGRVGFTEYVYAPKDDAYHRERWREPYPDDELARIGELARAAADHGVVLRYAVSPALSMRFADDADHRALATKCEQVRAVGVTSFALLFDDVPAILGDEDDRLRFGDDERGTGTAHGAAAARFEAGFLHPAGIDAPVMVCPTDYAGVAPSPYREGLAATLPEDAEVMWTGSDVVVGEVTRDDIDRAAASYRRSLVLWDNFPVNDFDRSRLFLGPIRGRTTDLLGSALVGICANPMVEAAPSRFALATVADWAWNPRDYDPDDAARRALHLVAGADADDLAALVAACASWPPSAPQSAVLGELCDAALTGDAGACERLQGALTALAAVGARGAAADSDPLRLSLAPWTAAARDSARAGLLACDLLRRISPDDPRPVPEAERQDVEAALERSDANFPNVLRGVVPPFVRAVLARAGGTVPDAATTHRVLLVTGDNRRPGDRDLAERLGARGIEVRFTSAPEQEPDLVDESDLVIVGVGASTSAAAALAHAPVPLIAWARLHTLGLTDRSQVALARQDVRIVAPGHPLAAGVQGEVRVYRGPGKLTWTRPGPEAAVVARTVEEDEAVITHHPLGARLVDGRAAPAERIAFLLGDDGLAPWLVAPDGHALFDAAVDMLLATPRS